MVEVREPCVAGAFYPASAEEVREMLDGFKAKAAAAKNKSVAVVSPHAGWVYSGLTATHSFLALKPAKTFVVVSPNHSGYGASVAASDDDWLTPLGEVKTDKALVEKLVAAGAVEVDREAHAREHSVEVQLPFLQYLFKDFRLVAVTLMDQSLETAERLGKALAESAGHDVSVVASSDFTHYEPADAAKKKDLKAIQQLEKMDLAGFYEVLEKESVSACGYGPIAAAASFAKARGCKRGELLHFSNSGEASGDFAAVVDYAGIAFY